MEWHQDKNCMDFQNLCTFSVKLYVNFRSQIIHPIGKSFSVSKRIFLYLKDTELVISVFLKIIDSF